MIGKFNKNGFQWDFNIFTFSTTSPVSPYLGFTFQDHFLYPRHQIFWRNKLTLWRICNIWGPLDRKSLHHVRMKNSKVFVILLLVAHWMKFYKKADTREIFWLFCGRMMVMDTWHLGGSQGHIQGPQSVIIWSIYSHQGGPRKRYLFRDY